MLDKRSKLGYTCQDVHPDATVDSLGFSLVVCRFQRNGRFLRLWCVLWGNVAERPGDRSEEPIPAYSKKPQTAVTPAECRRNGRFPLIMWKRRPFPPPQLYRLQNFATEI